MRAILHRLRPGRGTACALVVLDDCGCRPVHRNPPIHHCRRRVRFANIRRSSADRRLADRFAVEPERRPLSNPHRSCRRPAAQFNALLSAIPASERRARFVPRGGLRKERYPLINRQFAPAPQQNRRLAAEIVGLSSVFPFLTVRFRANGPSGPNTQALPASVDPAPWIGPYA
jgi:hypothetical protein